MKRFWLPVGLALVWTIGAPFGGRVPFELRIVNEDTGMGLSDIRVTTDNGIVCRTQRGTGACFWSVPSVLDRSVGLQITDENNRFVPTAATLKFTPGGQAIIALRPNT